MLAKINKLQNWQAGFIITLIGFAVFFSGLANPFQGDDNYQIVNNLPVHSLKNLFLFFRSSTFYNGQKLIGVYYRPLMTTVFSFVYSLFGPHPLYFHIFQLVLYIACAYVLYLVFKRFFKPAGAIILALVFLVHPINSQVAYAIPSMQDALFFFFGILALWILINYKSNRSLWLVAGCLLASFLSKETAVVFFVIAFLYLFWFSRERLRRYVYVMIWPFIIYFLLKINAVGLNSPQHGAPIDNFTLAGRLMTDPSIVLFYLTKFIFPWHLASGYYWTYPSYSFRHVLLPLLIDLAVVAIFVYLGIRVRKHLSNSKYHAYLFFAAWAVIGIIPYLQIISLDMTACETWFYFSIVGLLGMIGIALLTIKHRLEPGWLILPAVLLTAILGVRSAVRGTDYSSQYNLARADLKVSSNDYSAMNNVAQGLIDQGKYKPAIQYAEESAAIYPTVSNYDNLGVALEYTENYAAAVKAYNRALQYGSLNIIYENLVEIALVYGTPASHVQLFEKAFKAYPTDFKIWLYLAIMEDEAGATANSRTALSYAVSYGQIPQVLYNDIYSGQQFSLQLPISKYPLIVR